MHLGIQSYIVRTAWKHAAQRYLNRERHWKTMLAGTMVAVEWQRYQIVGYFVECDLLLMITGRASDQNKI